MALLFEVVDSGSFEEFEKAFREQFDRDEDTLEELLFSALIHPDPVERVPIANFLLDEGEDPPYIETQFSVERAVWAAAAQF